jgi:hypothetical protein
VWTILSGVFGGVLRLVPELFKYLNAKEDRKHELAMQEVAFKFQELKGNQKIDEIKEQGRADWDKGGLDALKAAIEAESKPSGVKWIDGFSKLMRPLITFQWVCLLYPGVIVTTFWVLIERGVDIIPAMAAVFGEPEKALVSFIVDFWFVGRILDAGRNRNK